MAKPKKPKQPRPDKYAEKFTLDTSFEETMKLLAAHANTKGTKNITYQGRERVAQQ